MSDIRTKLQGKKTYILAALGVLAVWADYLLGLGLSDLCSELEPCTISLAEAVKATFGIGMAVTMKAGIDRK